MAIEHITLNKSTACVLVILDAGVTHSATVCASRASALNAAWDFFCAHEGDSTDVALRSAKNKLDAGQLDACEYFLDEYAANCDRYAYTLHPLSYIE